MPFAPASSGRTAKSMDRMMQSVLNASKTLLANIRFMSVDHPIKTIVITSSVPNEGKPFIASNLASAIATSGKGVLLVECDMRRRSLYAIHCQLLRVFCTAPELLIMACGKLLVVEIIAH